MDKIELSFPDWDDDSFRINFEKQYCDKCGDEKTITMLENDLSICRECIDDLFGAAIAHLEYGGDYE